MSSLQYAFIAVTFLGPPLLWLLSRKVQSPHLVRRVSWALAAALLGAYAITLVVKVRVDRAGGVPWTFDDTLPMQLCDWAALATIFALISRRQMPFELAYFWGLAGTSQALFTPAIDISSSFSVAGMWSDVIALFSGGTAFTGSLRIIMFLVVHSAIPAGVLWMMFEFKMRPQPGAFWRTLAWSELYLAAALIVNAVCDANYGFLSHPPSEPTLLDHFSHTHWLYVLEINLVAVVVFAVLYAPWWFLRRRGTRDALA